jgi:O-antigen ligase
MDQTLRRDLRAGLLGGVLIGAAIATAPPLWGWLLLAAALVAGCCWVASAAHRWVLCFLATLLLLPPLPLPGGDSGPHPALLLAGLGLWAGIVQLNSWRFRTGWLAAALFLLFGALLLSVPWAAFYSGAEAALGSLARVGLLGLAVYLFFYLAYGPGREVAPERLIRVLFWAGLASALFACLDFYFQFPAPARFAPQFIWLPGSVYRRAQGVFYEASTLASLCVFLLVLIAVAASQGMHRRLGIRRSSLALAAVVSGGALLLSFSRAALISLLTSLAALAWLERGRLRFAVRPRPVTLAVAAAFSLAVFVMYRLLPGFVGLYLARLQSSGEFFLESPNLILSRRLESWSYLLDYLREHPWQALFGIGYKTLPYSDFTGQPVIADNMYLSLLVETGWIGLTALLLLNAVILVTCYRWATAAGSDLQRLAGAWMFCFWCGQVVQMMSGDTLTYWRLLPAYFAVLALGSRHADPVS